MLPVSPNSSSPVVLEDTQIHIVASILSILTNFREEHPSRILHSFQIFAEAISQIDNPFVGTPFENISKYLSSNGGLVMCRHAWDRGCMDLERIYYLTRLRSLLRIDIVAKINPNQLVTPEEKNLYFFLTEFSPMQTREDVSPEKVHELSEFMETEYQNIQKDLPLPLFLRALQAINLFTHSTLAYLCFKPLTCAPALDYWVKKMPVNEAFPTNEEFSKMIEAVGDLDFTRPVREEKFEERRWRGFRALNKLTQNQLLMWHPNGKLINQNYRGILRRMKRGNHRMIHICAIDTCKQVEKDEKKAISILDKIVIVAKKIFIWLFGYRFHHPNFLTYLPELSSHAIHGKKVGSGIYQNLIDGEPKRHIREFEINVTPWLPEGVDPERFQRVFFTYLEEIIRKKNRHLKLSGSFIKLSRVLFPHFTPTVPEAIDLADPVERTVTCNQFVGEALVEAHVRSSREFGSAIPESLEFYGFRKGDNLGSMTPTHFVETLIAKEVLRECWSPLI